MRSQATVLTFLFVIAAYFIYGWGIVPLVLPDISKQERPSLVNAGNFTRGEIEPFLDLLPEDGWERDPNAEIFLLQSEQAIILFSEDKIEGNGNILRLEPCTILLLPGDMQKYRHDEEETRNKIRQAVVLRTPTFAEIELDSNVDITKMSNLNFVTGRLWGKVTVQSGMQNRDTQDDFYLETENVEIKEEADIVSISTLKDVQFKFGEHSGEGTGLTLKLVPSAQSEPNSNKELESVVVRKLKSLRLAFPDSAIDVRCQDSFVFAANRSANTSERGGWTASFLQNVEMVRNNPDDTIDKLTAEEVHLTLAAIGPVGNRASQFDRLEPALFIARGKPGQGNRPPVPARLSVKHEGDITLVGDEIFLDLRQNFLQLSTRKEAGASPFVEMILADQYTIRSEERVKYTFGQDRAIGRFIADGKGHLIGKIGEGIEARDIRLDWNEMQMSPHPQVADQIVLKLDKGISARMLGFGTMTAEQLELHCVVAPQSGMGNPRNNLMLDQVSVRNNVRFETASGTCRVQQLHILFKNLAPDGTELHSSRMLPTFASRPPSPPSFAPFSTAAPSSTILQVQHLQPIPLYQPPAPPVAGQVRTAPPLRSAPRGTQQGGPQGSLDMQNLMGIRSSSATGPFDITGDMMRMRVRTQNGLSSAEKVLITGNVHLQEKTTNNASTAIEMKGDTVVIWDPTEPTTKIQIVGRAAGHEAIFKGRGIETRAAELNIAREDNIFWSPGPGQLIAHIALIDTSKTPNDDRLIVNWNKKMRCNGLILQFEGEPDANNNRVNVEYQTQGTTQKLWCNEMQISLNRQVMFFDDTSDIAPEPVDILCVGNVHITNLQRDRQGKQQSLALASVSRLRYIVERQYFFADGPGELSLILLGSARGFGPDRFAVTPNRTGNEEKLNHLAVWFPDKMQGTHAEAKTEIDISGRKVEVAYCLADSWNDRISRVNLSAVRQRGYTLECEHLKVVEVSDPANPSQSFFDLTASHTAIIEGRELFGKAQTIRYSQEAGVIDLVGGVTLHMMQGGQTIQQSGDRYVYDIETGSIRFQSQGLLLQ